MYSNKCYIFRCVCCLAQFFPTKYINQLFKYIPANFGNFTFNFNTYRSSGYETPVKSFPINLKLRDWLYFEVNATVGDPSLVLLIERCYSTPTMNPDEPVKYDLIKGG